MAQLMPLPLTVSCFSKIQIGFTFVVLADPSIIIIIIIIIHEYYYGGAVALLLQDHLCPG